MCRWTGRPLYGDLYLRVLENHREKTVRDCAVFVGALEVFRFDNLIKLFPTAF